MYTFLSSLKEKKTEMFKLKFWFSMFRYSVSVFGLWHKNTYWHLKSHTASKLWMEGISDLCLVSFPPWLALHGWCRSCSLPVLGHHIQISRVWFYIYPLALNMPERPSLTLGPAGKGQPAAILFSPYHSDYIANRERSHLHIKSSTLCWNYLGGWYLAQTMTMSGTVAVI